MRESSELFRIMFLCMLWYVVSSSANIVGKTLLLEFPYPMTATMVQLTSITVLSGPIFRFWDIRRNTKITWTYYAKLIVPLALGKFLGSVLSHVSIWKVPVSYTHTGRVTHMTCACTSLFIPRIDSHLARTIHFYGKSGRKSHFCKNFNIVYISCQFFMRAFDTRDNFFFSLFFLPT